jgi:hypothetical protein
MSDLRSKPLIVVKGVLFLGIAASAAALLAVLVWSSCRFYYFLFYVLEKYLDPGLRYAGLWALAEAILRQRRQ